MEKKITDCCGNPIKIGDAVKLINVPLDLFLLHTEPEQNILRAEIGNTHLIQEIDQYGIVKLDFYDKYNLPHTIHINASCVERSWGK